MEKPTNQQELYSNLTLINFLINRTKECIYFTQFDDVNFDEINIISDLDKSRLYLIKAIDRLQGLEQKGPKNVCY